MLIAEYPAVKILPLWHGTRSDILDSICRVGYANLASTDAGFFGKGLYSTHEAEYAHRVYSQGALLLNWVATYSPYPAIDGDLDKLREKGNYQNYDAHFVPVVPKNPSNPNETVYYPTKPNQKHTYTEVVVFESAACLPRYLVELQATLKKPLAVTTPSSSSSTPPSPSMPSSVSSSSYSSTSKGKSKVIPSQNIKPTIPPIPSMAFGKAQWERFFGDVGVEPALPPDIDQILSSPCPFWKGKKVSETHLLTLIPKTVDGKPLTLTRLGELIEHPKQGTATKYCYYDDMLKKQYGSVSVNSSHWVLMTRDVIPDSRSKSYADQQKLVTKAGQGYTVPPILDATASILMAYFATGERLYGDKPWTFTRCQEEVGGYQTVCGGFDLAGLHVGRLQSFFASDNYGVGAFRKF